MSHNPSDSDPKRPDPDKKPEEAENHPDHDESADLGGMSGVIPTAEPASGNLEPIAPVAPSSGWLDDDPTTMLDPHASQLPVSDEESTELLEAKPVVEGSDIFSAEAIPPAPPFGGSDVIDATLTPPPPREPREPDRPSEIALSFGEPPSGELPVADEVLESSSGIFGAVGPDDTPDLPESERDDDSPSYGKHPELIPDASSILSDLTEPADEPHGNSSSIRVESPGVERTLSSNPRGSTEFDLDVNEGDVPPELAEAAAGEGVTSGPPSESDLYINPQSAAEIDLTRTPIDPDPELFGSGSSIFSARKTPVPGGTGASSELPVHNPAEEDVSVEFTDHPTAEPEGSDAAVLGPNPPIGRRTPRPPSEVDVGFDLPPELTIEDSNEGMGDLPSGVLDSPSSDIIRRPIDENAPTKLGQFETGETRTPSKSRSGRPDRTVPSRPLKAPSDASKASDPSIEIDWMAGSSSEVPVVRHEPRLAETTPAGKAKTKEVREEKPAREPAQVRRGGGGWLGGTILGMVIAGGASAGIYFGGLVPNSEKQTAQTQPGPRAQQPVEPVSQPGGQQPGVQPSAPQTGQGRLMARVQELAKANAGVKPDDPELQKAREELQAVADDTAGKGEKAAAEATLYLGVSHEIAGDRAEARKLYKAAREKFPHFAATFDAALERLAATAPAGEGTSRRLTPADAQQVIATVILLQAGNPPAEEPEAGVFFWKAVTLASAGRYTEAIDQIGKAKAAHAKQAKAMAGRGLNPLSDPLEQIFPRCCDDLKEYWELRGAIYAHKAIAEAIKKDGAEKVMKELADAQAKAATAVKLMTELTDANTRLTKANTDLKDATDKLAKAQSDLTDTNTKLTKATTDFKEASDKVAKAEKNLKDAREAFEKREQVFLADAAKAQKELTETTDAKAKAERERDRAAAVITSLAKELQATKLLPEKYDNDALLAAQKAAMQRATGPTLSALLPPGTTAIGGGGLAAGQLMDVAERLTKAEAAAKLAADRLAAETKKLTTEHAAELKSLKETHAAEVKKLTDTYTADVKKATETHAAELKKLTDTYATGTTKLKDEHAAELKKMSDRFAADVKKQGDDHAAALKTLKDTQATEVKKLTAGYDAKIKTLETTVAQQKVEADALAAKLKTELGNVLTPSSALDIWLPLLADLRRPADAAPALSNANKVLATAPANSEDAAKARTVAGWAYLLTGELPKAKDMFTAARSSSAYQAAAGKPWAKAADTGLASVDDPLASYRVPVPAATHDPVAAARYLDAGIRAYRAGRYADAVTALGEATKRDATDPLGWYFLGAAKWGAGRTAEAKEDFRQGAEREKTTSVSARVLNDALSPIQGAARDALNLARP